MSRLYLILIPIVLFATPAAAEWISFCASHTGDYIDSGIADEDYWRGQLPKRARGAWVTVSKNGTTIWPPSGQDGYTGDGIGAGDPGLGCTPQLTVAAAAGTYVVRVYSKGKVQGNFIEARDRGTGTLYYTLESIDVTGGSKMVPVPASVGGAHRTFRAYQAVAYALYRHAGGLTGQLFDLRVGDAPTPLDAGCTGNCYKSGKLWITTKGSARKFIIVHEAGHRLGDLATSGKMTGSNYSTASPSCPSEPAGASHSMLSKERAKAAFGEGFAHFYAADVFNDHNEQDCSFSYYKRIDGFPDPTVDCECWPVSDCSAVSMPVSYLESECVGWSGYSVEVDWLRTLWDMHTTPSGVVSFTDIVNWADSAVAWGDYDVSSRLDTAATAIGGSLLTAWSSYSSVNGVDH